MKLKKASEMRKAVADVAIEQSMSAVAYAIELAVSHDQLNAMCPIQAFVAIAVERKLRDLGYNVETTPTAHGTVRFHVSGF